MRILVGNPGRLARIETAIAQPVQSAIDIRRFTGNFERFEHLVFDFQKRIKADLGFLEDDAYFFASIALHPRSQSFLPGEIFSSIICLAIQPGAVMPDVVPRLIVIQYQFARGNPR